jgi:hypothetical protein
LLHLFGIVECGYLEIQALPVPELVEECDDLESAAPLDELDAREIRVPLFDQWEEFSATGYEEACCEPGKRREETS